MRDRVQFGELLQVVRERPSLPGLVERTRANASTPALRHELDLLAATARSEEPALPIVDDPNGLLRSEGNSIVLLFKRGFRGFSPVVLTERLRGGLSEGKVHHVRVERDGLDAGSRMARVGPVHEILVESRKFSVYVKHFVDPAAGRRARPGRERWGRAVGRE